MDVNDDLPLGWIKRKGSQQGVRGSEFQRNLHKLFSQQFLAIVGMISGIILENPTGFVVEDMNLNTKGVN